MVRLKIDEQGSDGIGDGSTPGMQHTIGAFAVSLEAETFGELGGVSPLDLNKVDRRLVRQAMEFAQRGFDLIAIFSVGVTRIPCDEADGLVGTFGQQGLCLEVEFNPGDAQLSGAESPRNQRHEDHGEDEDAGDFEPFRALVNIYQGGVNEDERYQAESGAGK